jgi:hypothetical protein
LPKAAQRLSPGEFVPSVEALLGRGHSVHVVYEVKKKSKRVWNVVCVRGLTWFDLPVRLTPSL